MNVGVGLFTGQTRQTDDRTWGAVYQEMMALFEVIESAGLDSAWVSEHHFTDDGYMPSLLPTLGGAGAVTDTIDLGTAVLLTPLHDPVRLAEDAATVSLLSSDRFVLGLANGYCDREFEQFGVDPRERAPRTEEAIRLLRSAWSDGPVGFDPRYHPISPETTITPKPDDAPPITLGGTAKVAVRRAALLGDGWHAPEPLSLEEIHKRVRYQRRIRAAEKRDDDFTVYVHQYCFVDDSKEAAWERLREPLFHVNRKYDELASGEPVEELSAERKRTLRDQSIYGSPTEVVEQLETYRETLGDSTHMVLRTVLPGIDVDAVRRSIERVGDEVAPQIR